MKFNKKQACENIVARLTPNGETLSLSERSINEQLDTLMPLLANDETELDAFINSCFPIFKTANANVNNDVSKGINKYKDEHPVQQPKEPDGDKNGQQQQQGSSDLEKRLAEMEKRLKDADEAKLVSGKKSEIKGILKDKGVKSEKWIDSILNQVQISSECDANEKAESLLTLYNETVASVDPSVVPFGNPGGQGSDSSIKSAIEDAAKLAKSMSY